MMKPFRRWLFNGMAVVSVVLWCAGAIIWVRSEWFCDSLMVGHTRNFLFAWGQGDYGYLVWTSKGEVGFGESGPFENPFSSHSRPGESRTWQFSYQSGTATPFISVPPLVRYAYGFGWVQMGSADIVILPLWLLLVVVSIWPLLWIRSILGIRRFQRAGRCLTCGYDLRATPDRCPECGTVQDRHSEKESHAADLE